MSGGTYNHLYRQKPGELLAGEQNLTAIRARLVELGAGDVATEVDEILAAIATYTEQVERQMSKLRDILQAVEQLDSNSTDEEHVREVIARFRTSHD